MDKFKCNECDRVFDNIFSLKIHRGRIHKITAEETYIDYMLNGMEPKCKCGCELKPKFLGVNEGFREFVNGHNSRVNNNFQIRPEIKLKSSKTQKQKYINGELQIWNKGLTIEDTRVKDNISKMLLDPERGSKISKALTGIPKTEEHKNKLSKLGIKRWEDPKRREAQAKRIINRLKENNYKNRKSKLELIFENILLKLGINFEYQFQLKHSLFDFYLTDLNILIEVDGDFHHCNPNSNHKDAIYPIQKKTKLNDDYKNNLAKLNNYTLIRFWEHDIKNNIDEVILKLKEIINQ